MKENIIQKNLPRIQHLMREYGVIRAYAFGSVVKGDMHPDSDVAFLITFQPETDYETYANNYFNLLYALQDLLKMK